MNFGGPGKTGSKENLSGGDVRIRKITGNTTIKRTQCCSRPEIWS